VVVVLALSPVLVPDAFDDDWLLMVGLCAMLLGYALEHLSRGTLAGNDRFGPYGLLLGGEAMARFLGCVVLAGLGVATAGPYGVVLGLAPFAGVAVALWRQRGLLEPGPPASWRELSRALGWLLGASLLAQVLVNAPPIVVKLLEPADSDLAGKMLQSLVIARVPLFFFQAVQAALVPDLAALAAARDRIRFRAGVGRLLVVLGALTVVSTALMLAIGPDVVGIAFGDEFALRGRDLGLLALASSIYLFALALAQVLVAIARPARAAAGWAAGVAALGVTIGLGSDVLLRTELGLLAGAVVSTVVMALLMTRPVHSVFEEPAPGGVVLEPGSLRVPEPGGETD
jgi:O-antigen/teichoic acid export membrane protein